MCMHAHACGGRCRQVHVGASMYVHVLTVCRSKFVELTVALGAHVVPLFLRINGRRGSSSRENLARKVGPKTSVMNAVLGPKCDTVAKTAIQ